MKYKFCYFILSHERANNVKTWDLLLKKHTKYPIYILIDDEDPQIELYKKNYEDNLLIFNKQEYKEKLKIDMLDNFNNMINCVIPRNYCFYIAKKLGYEYFAELDDDYTLIRLRYPNKNKTSLQSTKIPDLDELVDAHLQFLEKTPTVSLAFAQGGDYIGGVSSTFMKKGFKRKAMNFILHKTSRKVNYIGTLNDDVTAYTHYGSIGQIYLTFTHVCITQETTQSQEGGLTKSYQNGTYLKSIYSLYHHLDK